MKKILLMGGLIFLAVSSPLMSAYATKKKPREPTSTPQVTTLRASQPSVLSGGRPGSREVRFVSVRVSNVGTGEARDIQVFMEAAGGLAFPLKGPKWLPPRGSAVYSTSQRVPVGIGLKNHATVRCSTCRR